MTRALALPGLPPLLALGALILIWDALARAVGMDGLPRPIEAFREVPLILGEREAVANILASVGRMLVGFALAVAIGVPLGLAMGRSEIVARLANPVLMILYPVPKAALMPLIMLWLGVGDASKTLVIVLGVSIPVVYHAYQGARAVETRLLWSAAAMGMGRLRRFALVVLPAALPEILVGCRTGVVIALITMVTSEMIARQTGAGNILFNALDMAQYQAVYGMIVVLGALGILADAIFERVRRALVFWSENRDELAVGSA